MRSINKVILIGNVGKDPEIQVFESGRKRASFSLATSERYRDKSGTDQTITEWHNIVVWGPQAEIVEKYVRRGSPLYIEGRIKYREYTDKENIKRRITEIVLDNFSMLSTKSESDNMPNANTDSTPTNNEKGEDIEPSLEPTDDLPF